jgi:pimeloyl-ACP methyl ester carboxylesterase
MTTHDVTTGRGQGQYVEANGVHTYYEVEGSGEPLVLLHGGLCAIETLAGLRAGLVSRFRVYLPERRGHGRTPDVEGQFSYELFAEDTIAFMDQLGLSSAHVVGFSDGATVGLLVALQRPDLVRTLVHIGQQVNPSGIRPEFAEVMKLDAMPQGMLPPMLRDLYAAASPDGPNHWNVILGKAWQMITSGRPDIDLAAMGALQAPTLVMVADEDFTPQEHARDIAAAIPHAEVAVVANATHALPMEKPEVVADLVLRFIAEHAPPS